MVAKVTSWDVARMAGVSRTTVSMVLNKSETVSLSDETRRRVLQAASDLGYKPNSAARMLVRGDTETIGLIISDPAILPIDAFIPQLMHGISQCNREHGYHVLLEGITAGNSANPYESMVESRRIDGMIVLNPRSDDPNLRDLIDRGYPVVLVGSVRHPDELSVNFTTSEGISAAVENLVGLGHRKIGTVPFSRAGLIGTDVRLAVLRRELANHGIDLPDSHVEHANFSAESGHHATRRLLERHPDITAMADARTDDDQCRRSAAGQDCGRASDQAPARRANHGTPDQAADKSRAARFDRSCDHEELSLDKFW